MSGRPHYDPSTDDTDWHDPRLRGPSKGWHNNPRAEFLRAALVQIAECKSLTATSAQFAAHLQRLACKALTGDARAEPDLCNVCNAPQMVLADGSHACGERAVEACCWRCTQKDTCTANGFCSIERRTLGVKAAPEASAWWALVMGAAASIEDAANCLRDPDAKKQADGAAKHYREAAQKLMGNAGVALPHQLKENHDASSTAQAPDVGVDVAGPVRSGSVPGQESAQAAGAEGTEPCGHMRRGVRKAHCRQCMSAAYPGVPFEEAARRFSDASGMASPRGVSGTHHQTFRDQTP